MKRNIDVTPYLILKGFVADLVEILSGKDKERTKQDATLYLRQYEIRVNNYYTESDPTPFTTVKVFLDDDYYVSFCHFCINMNAYSRQTEKEDCSTNIPYELRLFLIDFVSSISDGSEGETVVLPTLSVKECTTYAKND